MNRRTPFLNINRIILPFRFIDSNKNSYFSWLENETKGPFKNSLLSVLKKSMYSRIFLFLFAFCLAQSAAISQTKPTFKVVIDPGHGGKDVGAKGQFSYEKDLNLAVSLRLGKLIKDSLPQLQVIYTRTTDIYPTLQQRHQIANQANADLFVSIHVNATAPRRERVRTGYRTVTTKSGKKVRRAVYKTVYHKDTKASGTETYVLGLHRNSQKESAISEFGEIAKEAGLLNENDPQTAIIIAQYSQAYLSRSVSLGTKIQAAFARQGRNDLGVKQMGLEVLAGSAMPGVLVEIGFINNREEEVYLNSDQGQNEVAQAIFEGIRQYVLESMP